jgi:hypothetical protein
MNAGRHQFRTSDFCFLRRKVADVVHLVEKVMRESHALDTGIAIMSVLIETGRFMLQRFALLCSVLLLLCITDAISQTVSPVIPLQGLLTNQSGSPTTATGSAILIFRLYDTPTGGAVKWEETQRDVAVVAGRFNVLLGSRTPFPSFDIFSGPLYLGITIDDGDPSTVDVEMRPRQTIVPVISAFHSNNADKLAGHDWSDLLVGGATDPSSAKIRGDKVGLSFDSATFDNSSNGLRIKAGAITTDLLAASSVVKESIADGAITADKIADGTIPAYKLSQRKIFTTTTHSSWSAEFSKDSANSWVAVSALNVLAFTSGRPMIIFLGAASPDNDEAAHLWIDSGPPYPSLNAWDIAVYRDSTLLGAYQVGLPFVSSGVSTGVLMPPPSCTTIDIPPTGQVTYGVKVRYRGSTDGRTATIKFEGLALYVIEL